MKDILENQDLMKLLDAYLEVNKAKRTDGLEDEMTGSCRKFKNPAKEKLLCAISGNDELEKAIDVIQNYRKSNENV